MTAAADLLTLRVDSVRLDILRTPDGYRVALGVLRGDRVGTHGIAASEPPPVDRAESVMSTLIRAALADLDGQQVEP